ncbi:hypothetical protein Ancab_008517 [Ancistrocladus abbreviatus]
MNRLGKLRHPNLVPLLGFCVVEEERLLVYKHMSNGTFYSLLRGGTAILDWPTRFRICLGLARGLAWLHHGNQPPYLHQNTSSNVILLDEDFDARIIDFGLASLTTVSNSNESSFVNRDLLEFGYIAPECSSTMVASLKGDAYAFGVVLLEIVTGQKPLEVSAAEEGFKGNLVDWVNQLSSSGRISEAIDKDLIGRGHDDEIHQVLTCNCVVSRPKDRFSMYQAYDSLNSMAGDHDFSEQFDEFPLIFVGEDTDGTGLLLIQAALTHSMTGAMEHKCRLHFLNLTIRPNLHTGDLPETFQVPTDSLNSSSYELQKGEDDEIERKIKKQSCLEDDNDACVYASNECCCELVKGISVYGFEQEDLERVELNQRVEAFIAMFRQHLVSNAK